MGEIIKIHPTPIVNLEEARRKKPPRKIIVLGKPIPRFSVLDPQFAPIIEQVSHRDIAPESVLIKRAERKKTYPSPPKIIK